jgi:hypothetical protein
MNKLTISFKQIASRITGISIPIFGVSWNPPESQRDIVRQIFIFLEDRRALYNDFAHELNHEVSKSVFAIRSELTAALKRLPENSEATPCFKAMRAACREYLDNARPSGFSGGPFSFMTELGKLRAIIGIQVSYLAVKYGIDVDGELMRVIPAELRNPRLLDE